MDHSGGAPCECTRAIQVGENAFDRDGVAKHHPGVRISIITPSYRRSAWLKLCVASVADQQVGAEHIVQDAGRAALGR